MLNRAMLMGRLTKDPDQKVTNSGIAVASFTLAVERNYKKDGNKETDFINIVAWRHTAEFVSKYFKKGMQVVVSGRIQTRTYDKEDVRHYVTEIVADETYFAEGKRDYDDKPERESVNDFTKEVEGFMPIDADDDLPF